MNPWRPISEPTAERAVLGSGGNKEARVGVRQHSGVITLAILGEDIADRHEQKPALHVLSYPLQMDRESLLGGAFWNMWFVCVCMEGVS